jgi:cation:H+ antiporter
VVTYLNLKKPIINFILYSLVIVVAGIWLISLSKALSTFPFHVYDKTLILGETIVGTIVLALVTSLPEVVIAITALRMGAANMAVANIFGSCTFNIFIIALLEPFVHGGSVFSFVSISVLIPAVLSIILMSIAVMGLIYRSHKSYFSLGWDGILIFFFYITGNIILLKIALTVQ